MPVILVALLAFALPRLSAGRAPLAAGISAADFAARPVAEDRPAPAFDLAALQGSGRISLTSLAGHVVVLNLWASWCSPCRQEAPQLEQVWNRYRSQGVRFVGVDHEDTRTGALAFVREFHLTYPTVFDPGGIVAARYGAVGIPTTFVINRDGRIVYRFLGKVQASTLGETVERVLAGSG